MTDIPQWARERALALVNETEGDPLSWGQVFSYRLGEAFARYIAEHEEPPVDPLLVEAREIVAQDCDGLSLSSAADIYRRGANDDSPIIRATLAALKRGIELGSKP